MSNLEEKAKLHKVAVSCFVDELEINRIKQAVELIITTSENSYKTGYSECKKEYEEKLRWIPVEEKLPEKMQTEPSVSKVVQVKSKNFKEPFCAFYNHIHNVWLPYPFGSNSQIAGITEWRSFL